MGKRYVTPLVPRDCLPPLSDDAWRRWSEQLRQLIDRNPVGWAELRAYAELIGTSAMSVRNLVAYLEEQGFASTVLRRKPSVEFRWCGCQDPTGCLRPGCAKR